MLSPNLSRPKSSQIGPIKYKISYDRNEMNATQVEHGCALYGATDHFKQLINIHPDLEHDRSCEVLLHENLHGLWENVLSAVEELKEEVVISALAPALLHFIRANKELIQFVQQEGTE